MRPTSRFAARRAGQPRSILHRNCTLIRRLSAGAGSGRPRWRSRIVDHRCSARSLTALSSVNSTLEATCDSSAAVVQGRSPSTVEPPAVEPETAVACSTLEGQWPFRDTMDLAAMKPEACVWGRSIAEQRRLLLTRVAVILHERLGNWVRQLRPRLHDQPIRWFETRSRADLDRRPDRPGVPRGADRSGSASGGRLEGPRSGAPPGSGRAGPRARSRVAPTRWPAWPASWAPLTWSRASCPRPVVAALLARWIALAQRHIERDGWSRTSFPESETEPWGWLAAYLGDPDDARLQRQPPEPDGLVARR